jgi:uncharacterized protein YbjT (DUF2867 family)
VTAVVTGAFSYTGRAIAGLLLERGTQVRTLSRTAPGAGDLDLPVSPLQFDDPAALRDALRGAETLYNTYWIRFPYGGATFEQAVARSRMLFEAAAGAGVRRIVHVSVSNPAADSPCPYFRGKAAVERELAELGVSHAIVRPTLVFGARDILVNNIAWILRRFPLFLLPGRGDYRVQPVAVEDVARIAVDAAASPDDLVVDAAGTDTLTFAELVRAVAGAVSSRARIVPASPSLALALTRLAGLALRDIVLTRDELRGLMAGLLVSAEPPAGTARFGAWLAASRETLGRTYVSELSRNWRGT